MEDDDMTGVELGWEGVHMPVININFQLVVNFQQLIASYHQEKRERGAGGFN